jgi:UDP-2,4-diacetamido-2,4,6-trideoxy-beta-L-altropyranose hydrolase
MRCLALANAFKELGHRVVFLTALCPYALKNWIKEDGREFAALPAEITAGSDVDAKYTVELAHEKGAQHVVIDGYHFLSGYQRLLKQSGLTLLCIDDLANCDYYCADLVLNQNPSAERSAYQNCEEHTDFLLGAEYILLRDDFVQYKSETAPEPLAQVAKRILVTMGGSDKDNVTGKVVEALALCPTELALQVKIVVGAGNQHSDWLQALAQKFSKDKGHSFSHHFNAKNMPELIGSSDLIVSAGGTTVWEAAYLARATAVIITADNQVAGMEHFADKGAVELLGRQQELAAADLSKPLAHLIKNHDRRVALAGRAATLVDGQGARRVVKKFTAKTI